MIYVLEYFRDFSWLTLGLLFCLLLIVINITIKRFIFIYAVRNIPHPIALPFIGNAYQMLTDLEEFFQNLNKYQAKYGTMYVIWIGQRPFIFLSSKETVQPILSSSIHINKSLEYRYLIPWLGSGLITSDGQRWRDHRKLLSPTFHSGLLEDYFICAMKEANIMINCLEPEIGKNVDIVPYAKRATLDVICVSSMGYRIDAQTNLFNEYVLAVDKLSRIVQSRFTNIWIKWDFVFKRTKAGREQERALKVVKNFVDKVIVKRKQEWENNIDKNANKPKHQALLDLLLGIRKSDGQKLTDTDIRDEVNTFMFAGHDTTATSISWTLYTLGRKTEYQQKILDEYNEIVGDGELTLEKLNKSVMLDACIKETWRMYPVAPLLARQIYKTVQIQEHHIPAGSTCLINTYQLHRDPRYFPEPNEYKPERFLPDQPKPPLYSYIPFSAGSRNCIGSKFATIVVKVFVLTIVKAYHIESLLTEDQLRISPELVLANVDGIPLSLTPRVR